MIINHRENIFPYIFFHESVLNHQKILKYIIVRSQSLASIFVFLKTLHDKVKKKATKLIIVAASHRLALVYYCIILQKTQKTW